ncbi:MAG TPA: hypothetical protein PLM07_18720 [Candidatus Rifleibacterium sp.]|nr:hypothetical protein [Candidatus Rifleibacterium sp.]
MTERGITLEESLETIRAIAERYARDMAACAAAAKRDRERRENRSPENDRAPEEPGAGR